MQFIQDTLGILGLAFLFVLPLWPVLVVPVLLQRRRNVIGATMFVWLVFFGGWLLMRWASPKPLSFLIPEPLNTYLFFLTGVGLLVAFLLVGFLRRRGTIRSAEQARSPEDLLKISPGRFEEMVVELYRRKGAKAWRTGATGDHGVDVVLQTPKGEKWVVQCKRWRGWVGEPVVPDFYGTMQHEKAHRGVLITTGTFSKAAREWAKGKPLALVDGEEFLRSWRAARAR